MKKTILALMTVCGLLFSANALAGTNRYVSTTGSDAADGTVGTPWQHINYAIAHSSATDVINVGSGTFAENVVVNLSVTISGTGDGTIITPSSGVGVTVSANSVTLQNFRVTGASNHGIYAGTVSNLTISQVTADLNGTVANRSGIALQNVATATITNVTVQNNAKHGLEIGNGSSAVSVSGGTFSGNGVPGDITTGAGIIVYADAAATTNGTQINGAIASGNKTAGIMLYCTPGGTLSGTVIGNTLKPTLNDNGSSGGGYGTGGAAILVFGHCTNTTISANSTNNNLVNPTAGLVMLGSDASGANSPATTVVQDCNLTGYTSTSPAATMYAHSGSNTLICTNDVDASVGNSINGAGSGYTVEDVLMHKVDNYTLGLFRGPGTELYVTTSSGSIQRAINVAGYLATATPSLTITKIHVNSGSYNEALTVNKSLYILGEGGTQPIVTPPGGSVGINITVNGVTIDNLEVTGATGGLTKHGIWANGVNGLTIQNVNAHDNAGSGIALRAIPASPVSTVKNVTASNNLNQGLEIGNGSDGVVVDGGTFNSNGTTNNLSTGGGIMLYADVGSTVKNIAVKGTVIANTNKTAGIYIYSDPGTISGTAIGQASGSSITLTDNGSYSDTHSANGGAGVLVFGAADLTTITAAFSGSGVPGAGLVALGTNGSGANSPTNVSVHNSTFTGYTSSYPAITLEEKATSPSYISTTPLDAFTSNTFTSFPTYTDIQTIVFDKNDNSACGLISLPQTATVTTTKNVEVSLISYLSMTSSVDLTNVNVAIAQILAATNSTGTGTLVTGVTVEIPTNQGTVADEVLQISANLPLSGYVEFKYKIQTRGNFSNTTRVQHFHDGVWTDLGRVIRYDYDLTAGGSGSQVNITDVPASGVSAIYAIFSTNSTSTFAFVTPTDGLLDYLTPSNTFQSATVSTAYSSSLTVTVNNVSGTPKSGIVVTFTRPSSGASVTFTSGTSAGADAVTATTDGSGVASVTVTANGNTGSFNVTATTANGSAPATFGLTNNAVTLASAKIKVFLQGAYSGGVMTTTLNSSSFIPVASNTAYNAVADGYTAVTVGSIPNANIVDWVLVELRTGTAASTKVETQVAFLLTDGRVVASDGSSDVAFSTATVGSYYVVIRHRNHLAIMSAAPIALPNATVYDFSTASTQAYGTNPMVSISGVYAMWDGDTDGSGVVNLNDRNNTWNNRNQTNVYSGSDTDLSNVINLSDRNNTWNNRNLVTQVPN